MNLELVNTLTVFSAETGSVLNASVIRTAQPNQKKNPNGHRCELLVLFLSGKVVKLNSKKSYSN